nr:esterase FE4-like [Penaeus vannamei]
MPQPPPPPALPSRPCKTLRSDAGSHLRLSLRRNRSSARRPVESRVEEEILKRAKMRLLLASAALLWLSAAAAETVEVQLQQGAIVGSRSEAKGGRAFYGFLGIPFAQPPVGALRFKDPVAAGAWEGVRNGTVAPPLCPQPDAPSDWMQEDCLYLSVFTPQPNRTDLPVMVWLPQGGFISDATPLFQPEFLLAKDVVLVVLQHRLGVLGFLSTEDAELPGNLGLKDQAMALRWVQDNIRDLGGDPDKVTIFGQNAGGAAVHYHMLSPMSSGLFQRAIMQSGAALCPWALREDHRQVAFGFGRMVGCPGERADAANSTALVDCLRDVPVEQLMAVTPYITVSERPSGRLIECVCVYVHSCVPGSVNGQKET